MRTPGAALAIAVTLAVPVAASAGPEVKASVMRTARGVLVTRASLWIQ